MTKYLIAVKMLCASDIYVFSTSEDRQKFIEAIVSAGITDYATAEQTGGE